MEKYVQMFEEFRKFPEESGKNPGGLTRMEPAIGEEEEAAMMEGRFANSEWRAVLDRLGELGADKVRNSLKNLFGYVQTMRVLLELLAQNRPMYDFYEDYDGQVDELSVLQWYGEWAGGYGRWAGKGDLVPIYVILHSAISDVRRDYPDAVTGMIESEQAWFKKLGITRHPLIDIIDGAGGYPGDGFDLNEFVKKYLYEMIKPLSAEACGMLIQYLLMNYSAQPAVAEFINKYLLDKLRAQAEAGVMESFVPMFEEVSDPAYVSYTIVKARDGGIDGVMVNKWKADGRKYLSHTSEQEEEAAQGEVMELGDGTWAEALRILDARHGDDLWVENEPAVETIKQMIRMRAQWRRIGGNAVTRIYALDEGGFGGGEA